VARFGGIERRAVLGLRVTKTKGEGLDSKRTVLCSGGLQRQHEGVERRDQLRDVGRLRLQDTVERPARGMGPPGGIVIDRLTFTTVAASAGLEKTGTAEIVEAAITKEEERRRVTSGSAGTATFLLTKGVGLA
jgi:hypothetical protein